MTRTSRVRGLIIVYGLFATLLLCGTATAQQADGDLAEAVRLFQERSFEAAISSLEQIVQQNPEDATAWYYLGVSRLRSDDMQGALDALSEASDLQPGRPGTQLYMGEIYERLGAYDEAIRAYQTELRNRRQRNITEVWNALGRVYYLDGRFREAVEATTEALRHNPRFVEALYHRGLTRHELRELSQSERDFRRAVEVIDEWDRMQRRLERMMVREAEVGLPPDAQRDRQRLQEDLAQDYARAAEFAQILTMRPWLYIAHGDVSQALKEWANARNSYRKALNPDMGGNPADPLPHVKIGEAYFEEARYKFNEHGLLFTAISTIDVAIDATEEAFFLDQGFPPAHKTLGDIFHFQAATYSSDPEREIVSSVFEDALARYDEAIAADPQYVAAYKGRAQTHLAMGAPERAIADLRAALDLEPRNPDLWAALATAYVANEDYERVIQIAETAIGLRPDNAVAHNAAGLAHYYRGDLGQAQQHFTAAIRADPSNHQAYTNLGNTFFQMSSWHRARVNYEQALNIIPTPAIANTAVQRSYLYYLIARTYHFTGQYEREIAALNQALALDAAYIEALTQLAAAYGELRRFQAAEQALQTALTISPDDETDAMIHVQMGRLYEQEGRTFEAITAYGAALSAQRENLEAREALRRLTSG